MAGFREIRLPVAGWAGRGVRAALDVVFPPLCLSCRVRLSEPHALCSACWSGLGFIDGPQCERCGLPFEIDPGGETQCGACLASPHAFDRARSLLRYDDASKPLILAFKHGDRLDQAPGFARWLERAGRPLLEAADLLVPVPLHRWRLWRRRYNQSALLGQGLARLSGRPQDPFLLQRKRATPSQGRMASAEARTRNVMGAFRIAPGRESEVEGRHILLVDDVFTTGATLDACARVLKRAGAARVDALTLARVVRALASDI
jgi:ComF family protein